MNEVGLLDFVMTIINFKVDVLVCYTHKTGSIWHQPERWKAKMESFFKQWKYIYVSFLILNLHML
jgi:hypothetical protein